VASCAAKAAVLNLSKGRSKTNARYGVSVNAVSLAVIATPMKDAMPDADDGRDDGQAGEATWRRLR